MNIFLLAIFSNLWLTVRSQGFNPLLCRFAENKCPNERINFWLYTNQTRDSPILLDPMNPDSNLFEPRLPLKILIHGFNGNRSETPNWEVRDVLLQAESVHVVTVDYGSLVRFPCYYPWSVLNARVVAKCVAQLVDGLVGSGVYQREQLHLIGFSLGAQIAGLAANHVQTKLARITGLDPAGPGFLIALPREKLDKSDADFVDVIHTDPFFFSMLSAMGHVDFYPNLKSFGQPGCKYVKEGRFFNCNHFRAAVYYAESIVSERGFWSNPCGGWVDFFMQRCSQFTHLPNHRMGYFVAQNATGSYFLNTHEDAPFAKGPLVDFEMVTAKNDVTTPQK